MTDNPQSPLTEGKDYYLENGLFVFTEDFLRRRGYCCRSGCRHCPYGFRKNEAKTSQDPAVDDPPAG